MQGNPNLRAASVHPFHWSGSIVDDAPSERREADAERLYQPDDDERVRSLSLVPPPAAKSPVELLAAELAEFLGRRQESDLDQLPYATQGRSPRDTGARRDQLLAEIEILAEALKEKVARYSSLRESQSTDQTAQLADANAAAWIQDALEDIAETATGIEIASRELFIRAGSAGEQDSGNEPAHVQAAGTAE